MNDSYEIVVLKGADSYDTANISLFNSEEYAALYPEYERYTGLILSNEQEVLAKMQLFIHEDLAFNPLRAPFGGMELDSQRVTLLMAGQLLDELIALMIAENKERIRIVTAPECYGKAEYAIIESLMKSRGFEPVFTDINFHQPIVAEKEFSQIIHQKERNRLHKCRREGFYFCENDEYNLQDVYKFIKVCRERKGYPLTLDPESFIFLFNALPHRYLIFSVRHSSGDLAALSVAVAVNEAVLYNFYLADHHDYLSYSPAVMLHEGLYNFCKNNNISMLDMGISTDRGIPNEGLMNFKNRIGGIATHKITWEKTL